MRAMLLQLIVNKKLAPNFFGGNPGTSRCCTTPGRWSCQLPPTLATDRASGGQRFGSLVSRNRHRFELRVTR
eukprot:11188837-Lingulodinium_polyedra.AAC.1